MVRRETGVLRVGGQRYLAWLQCSFFTSLPAQRRRMQNFDDFDVRLSQLSSPCCPTMSPAAPVAPPASPSSQPILEPLVGALIQCVCLIVIGYGCKRSGLFSAADASGLSAFVGRLSLPALLFLSMATLDIQMIDKLLLCTILVVKGLVFLLVVISCRITDGLEVASP